MSETRKKPSGAEYQRRRRAKAAGEAVDGKQAPSRVRHSADAIDTALDAEKLRLDALGALQAVATAADAPPAARAAAARTLLEFCGSIGRHAEPPVSTAKPASEMTLAELDAAIAALD